MSKWGKPTKNRKRIDPRYFINETTNRDLKEYAMEPPMSEEPPRTAREPASVDYVLRSLQKQYNRGAHPSQRRGMPFRMGVNSILDALMIDDVWPEDEEALQQTMADANAQSVEELAPVVADWLTKYRQGGHSTEAGRASAMEKWR